MVLIRCASAVYDVGMNGRDWKELTVRLGFATVSVFDGPDREWTLIVHGVRARRNEGHEAAKRPRKNGNGGRKK